MNQDTAPASDSSPDPQTGKRRANAAATLRDGPINILIVDDEPKNLTVLETILDDPRYRLIRAESADQALLALVVEEFALLILDIRMPRMTGFELAQIIKERKKTARVPIIFLTAYYNEDQHVLEGYGTGAVDYLHKPVNPAILRSKVAVFAELHRKNRESDSVNRALLAEVTERRRAEEQLQQLNETLEQRVAERMEALAASNAALNETSERYRSLFEGSIDAIFSVDADGRFVAANAAAVRLAGCTFEEMKTRRVLDFCAPEKRAAAESAFRTAFSNQCRTMETTILTADGERRDLFISGTPALVNGKLAGVSCIARDITERKRAEVALKEADRRKDEFLAMLAHELRNPLAPIRNSVQLLRLNGSQESTLSGARDMIERQVNHLVRLVDDLLDVSRVSSGKIRLQKGPLDLAAVVNQAVELTRMLIEAGQHQLTVTLPPETVRVEADYTRMAQVISNLLNNAAKYTDQGGNIWLTVEKASESVEGPGEAVIRVRDTGRGIDPSALKSLFELFYQADRNLDRSDGGLGVGLSIVSSLVEMHGGRVEAHSAGLGKGSEFVVRLPLLPETPSVLVDGPAPAPLQGSPIRILVVDDNRDSADSMALLLQMDGHEVSTAHDGKQAVEMALRDWPDVVLLDIGLPHLDGYQACQAMRDGGLTDALIVAITGYGQDEDRRRSQEARFDAHHVKPVDLRLLRELLAKQVAGHKVGQAS